MAHKRLPLLPAVDGLQRSMKKCLDAEVSLVPEFA
jgi:hypothetical protein